MSPRRAVSFIEETVTYEGRINSTGKLIFYQDVIDYLKLRWGKDLPADINVYSSNSTIIREREIYDKGIVVFPPFEKHQKVKLTLTHNMANDEIVMRIEEA